MTRTTFDIRGVPVQMENGDVGLAKEMIDGEEVEVVVHPDYDDVYHLPHDQNSEKPAPLCRPIEYKQKARAPAALVSEVDRNLCNHCASYVLDELP